MLHDINAAKLEAEVLDISHGRSFTPRGSVTGSDDIEVCRGARLVVTTAALQATGLPPRQLFGSGTVLDSSRLRHGIASRIGLAVQSVHAYVVGEHGDTEFPLWSSATVGGVPIREWSRGHGGELDDQVLLEIADEVVQLLRRSADSIRATAASVGG